MSCAAAKSSYRCHTPLRWTLLLLVLCVAFAPAADAAAGTAGTGTESATSSTSQQHLRRLVASSTTTAAAGAATAIEEAERRRLNIFGDDDRRPVSDPSLYPYSAVGLLRWSDTLSCTASLIADKFVVTAAECALDADGNVRKSSFEKPQFLPGYAAAKAAATTTEAIAAADKALVTKVHKQSDYWKKWTQNTYVILELDAPIGQRYGVLQLPSLPDLDQSTGKTEVQLAGYDDKALDLTKAAMQYAKCTCYFPSEFNGPQYMLLHDCDTSAVGSPGSPLLVRYTTLKTYIIGIHSNAIGTNSSTSAEATTKFAEFNKESANRGVLGPFIQKHLESLVGSLATSGGGGGGTSSSSAASDSRSGSRDGGKATGSTNTPKPSTPSPSGGASSRADADDADANPQTPGEQSSSSNASKNERITPAAAYICIAFVCFAWASILFVAIRHVRRGGGDNDDAGGGGTGIDDDEAIIEL